MTFPAFNQKKARRPERFFTLIELLVVVALMGLILAVGMPAFEKLTIGSGVAAAARQLSAQLRLARQYAISNRCKVAVVMPTEESTDINEMYRYTSFRSAVVTGTGSPFVMGKWVDNTKWTFLPTGSAIVASTGSTAPQKVNTVPVPKKTGSNDTVNVDVNAVVFSPTGALAGNSPTSISLTLKEAVYNGSLQVRNDKNKFTIMINPFTGRTEIQ